MTPPRAVRAGFTLVEVLLAGALAVFIGMAVLMMLGAVVTGTSEERDTRAATLGREVVALRLGPALRSTSGVLAASDERLLLWIGDINGNGGPELSELRMIRLDTDENSVLIHEATDGLSPGDDTSFDADADFDAVASGLVDAPLFPGRRTLTKVKSVTVTLDNADPRAARRIRMHVLADHPSGETLAVVYATLRGEG